MVIALKFNSFSYGLYSIYEITDKELAYMEGGLCRTSYECEGADMETLAQESFIIRKDAKLAIYFTLP